MGVLFAGHTKVDKTLFLPFSQFSLNMIKKCIEKFLHWKEQFIPCTCITSFPVVNLFFNTFTQKHNTSWSFLVLVRSVVWHRNKRPDPDQFKAWRSVTQIVKLPILGKGFFDTTQHHCIGPNRSGKGKPGRRVKCCKFLSQPFFQIYTLIDKSNERTDDGPPLR